MSLLLVDTNIFFSENSVVHKGYWKMHVIREHLKKGCEYEICMNLPKKLQVALYSFSTTSLARSQKGTDNKHRQQQQGNDGHNHSNKLSL